MKRIENNWYIIFILFVVTGYCIAQQEMTNMRSKSTSMQQPTFNQGNLGNTLQLIKFNGTVPENTRSAFNIELSRATTTELELTFSIYAEQGSQTPLWTETQTVVVSSSGSYSVLLGSFSKNGMPSDMFADGAARWIGVQPANSTELPRVAIVSVPYAMKAANADMIGGHQVSDFVLTPEAEAKSDLTGIKRPKSNATISNGGSNGVVDQLAKFDSTSTIVPSLLYDDGTHVGVGTNSPSQTLDVVNSDTTGGGSPILRLTTPSSNGALILLRSTSTNGRNWGIGSNFITGTGEFGIYDYTGGVSRLFITSAGNFGIGTTNPIFPLFVQAQSGATAVIATANNDFVSGSAGSGIYMATGATSGSTYGQIQAFQSGNSAVGSLSLNPFGGNVGVGTASPSQLLEVNGAAKVDGALTAASTLSAGTTTVTGNLTITGTHPCTRSLRLCGGLNPEPNYIEFVDGSTMSTAGSNYIGPQGSTGPQGPQGPQGTTANDYSICSTSTTLAQVCSCPIRNAATPYYSTIYSCSASSSTTSCTSGTPTGGLYSSCCVCAGN